MIWSIVSKEEMKGCNSPAFSFYEEALGKSNIQLAVVDETDRLSFVQENDIVLLRTASKQLIDAIRKKGVKTTAEDYNTYYLAKDKVKVSRFLHSFGICVSENVSINRLVNGKIYFVKPRFGSESDVSTLMVCRSKKEVEDHVEKIRKTCKQDSIIELYLSGPEYTVACVNRNGDIESYPIDISGNVICDYKRKELELKAKNVFSVLGIKHHARIDFRSDNEGNLHVIDVNLIPSLGPNDKWCRCYQEAGFSYKDSLDNVINSATKQ